MARALETLASDIERLNASAQEYAEWNDTYDYILSRDPKYIESNLVERTFQALRLNILIILDNDGEIVWSKEFDPRANTLVEPMASRLKPLVSKTALQDFSDTNDYRAGLFKVAARPMAVAARPIRGTLSMVRVVELEPIENLTESANPLVFLDSVDQAAFARKDGVLRPLSEQFYGARVMQPIFGGLKWRRDVSIPNGVTPPPTSSVNSYLGPNGNTVPPIAVIQRNADSMGGYALLTDILGQP